VGLGGVVLDRIRRLLLELAFDVGYVVAVGLVIGTF